MTNPNALQPSELLGEKFSSFLSLSQLGTWSIWLLLVLAAFGVMLSLLSARAPEKLPAARWIALGVALFTLFCVMLLAYGFASHDFRIRYIAHYSDRSLPAGYLFAALWGGQDGSILWWTGLLAAHLLIYLATSRTRLLRFQPYVLATVLSVMVFFCVVMTFAANPFAENFLGEKADGEGLNPLLQNYYMAIHPPTLYLGFVGATMPFGFLVAALAVGDLGTDWIRAARSWMLSCWTFLSLGNALGMLWAYEVLGWGGWWAWDPVENAAFMPWILASAFLHSIILQDRRGMFRLWNIILGALTFFLTIWGTFLTRAGLIASVHSFAQSDIGFYFANGMLVLVGVCALLILYRLPEAWSFEHLTEASNRYRTRVRGALVSWVGFLAVVAVLQFFGAISPLFGAVTFLVTLGVLAGIAIAMAQYEFGLFAISPVAWLFLPLVAPGLIAFLFAHRMLGGVKGREAAAPSVPNVIDSWASREAAFVLNNWILVSFAAVIFIRTDFPILTKAFLGEDSVLSPSMYLPWVIPLGLILFTLMGVASLLSWGETSASAMRRAFMLPSILAGSTLIAHLAFGWRIGFPSVRLDEIWYFVRTRQLPTEYIYGRICPTIVSTLAAFNFTVIVQEYVVGVRAKMRQTEANMLSSLVGLVSKARRRYGGYVVHAGITLMFLGFAGSAYKQDTELAMRPGETTEFHGYRIAYVRPERTTPHDKQFEVRAEFRITRNGRPVATLFPKKTIFQKSGGMPTTDPAISSGFVDDVYLALGTVDANTKLATVHVFVNPLTAWIWAGVLVLLLGASITAWPQPLNLRPTTVLRFAFAVLLMVLVGFQIASLPARAMHIPGLL